MMCTWVYPRNNVLDGVQMGRSNFGEGAAHCKVQGLCCALCNKMALLSQGTTTRCRALVQIESLHLSSDNALNTRNTKTIDKRREVVEKLLQKCTSKGLIDVCRLMISRNPRTKVNEIRRINFDWPDPKFRRAPTKSVRDVRCEQTLLPGKIGQSSP